MNAPYQFGMKESNTIYDLVENFPVGMPGRGDVSDINAGRVPFLLDLESMRRARLGHPKSCPSVCISGC